MMPKNAINPRKAAMTPYIPNTIGSDAIVSPTIKYNVKNSRSVGVDVAAIINKMLPNTAKTKDMTLEQKKKPHKCIKVRNTNPDSEWL
mmetsp:Transcript_132133/g.382013  ORF Transcript_132133/g.382013 Transcript_132133/m.382013 type:complete len:88 (-) Transcript_132133:276-539(-)